MKPFSSLLGFAVAVGLAGCMATSGGPDRMPAPPTAGPMDPMQVTTNAPKPAWAPDIDPQMWAVVDQLMTYGNVPYPQLTGFQARMEKTPTNAVMDLLMKTGLPPMPPKVAVNHRKIPVGPSQGLLVRTYTPMGASGRLPVIVYFHGGGWVIADLDTYEAGAVALATKANAVVVSVAYRQAPENPYPAAHDDAFAAYQWVLQNAASINGDPDRVALAGESAGGNLAVATAIRARDEGVPMPSAIVSVYPVADGDVQSASYDRYANALPLNRGGMEWFFDNYTPDWRTREYDWIDLVEADLAGLPPTTVINAQIDPLEAEGGDLADALEAAGVDVERQVFSGVTHEFFGMSAVLEQAGAAQDLAARRLKAAWGM
ncbi:alpha/beta hydrolase [Rubrivirga sp.]|uniref:alpha/beta hydrolase n=1 Tax=Rubrivirga sp. TaxID=1885344 RepID=UPI003B529A54